MIRNASDLMGRLHTIKRLASMPTPSRRLIAAELEALAEDVMAGVQTRPLYEIAREIRKDWKPVDYAAQPYLDAMGSLDKITDSYMSDSAKSIVLYFLSNAAKWRGPKAKEIKMELKQMVK